MGPPQDKRGRGQEQEEETTPPLFLLLVYFYDYYQLFASRLVSHLWLLQQNFLALFLRDRLTVGDPSHHNVDILFVYP
jgi:hypothetical protein